MHSVIHQHVYQDSGCTHKMQASPLRLCRQLYVKSGRRGSEIAGWLAESAT